MAGSQAGLAQLAEILGAMIALTEKPMHTAKSSFRKILLWIFLASFVLVTFFLFEDDIDRLTHCMLKASEGNLWLVALVLFCVLASDVFLPVPSCLASTACGTFLGFPLGFAVSFAAMCASALIGYFSGRFCSGAVARFLEDDCKAIDRRAGPSGPFWLLLMRPVPVLAESSVIYAGMRRCPMGASFFWIALGNAGVSAVYAFIGAFGMKSGSAMPAFAVALALSGIAILVGKLAGRARKRGRGWRRD